MAELGRLLYSAVIATFIPIGFITLLSPVSGETLLSPVTGEALIGAN